MTSTSTFKSTARRSAWRAHWFLRDGFRHEWRFWDLAIQEALDFFGLTERGGNPY